MVFNLFLLLVIVFTPFPTALLAQYAILPDQHLAALLYSATFIALSIGFNLLWRYASDKNRLLSPRSDPLEISAITRQYRFGPLFYVIAFAIAWFNAPASIIFNFFLAVYFAFPGRRPRSEKVEMNDDEAAQ